MTRRMQRKVYRTQKNGLRWAAAAMTAVSFLLIAVGVIGSPKNGSQLAVEPSLTPGPTPVTRTFDETVDARQISVPQSPWYAIQLGVFESEDSALAMAEGYRSRGAAGYIWQDSERYRVLAAVYPDEEDAKRVRTQLKEGQSIDSYVFAIEPMNLTLKLSGMAGQLDVLEAIYTFWQETALELQKESLELDQREMDTKQVRERLTAMVEANEVLLELVSQRFTKPYHAAVQPAAELLQQFAAHLNELLANEQQSSVAIGAAIKYEALWMIAHMRQYYEQLTH